MREKKGHPLPLGVTENNGYVNFSVAVEQGKRCFLLIYEKGAKLPCQRIEFLEKDAVGEVRFLALQKSTIENCEYNYEIEGKVVTDPYVKELVLQADGSERGRISMEAYDWEEDTPLEIPYHEVIAYSLHVRGFTKHSSSKVKKRGTFAGVMEKIPYLKELGVNQIQCMPVYDFLDNKKYTNYWGYGDAYCFAPKRLYASQENTGKDLKDMVKACHRAGIEVVLNLPFSEHIMPQMMEECLRYYVLEYHIDGFILNPVLAPMEAILADPLLKRTKILQNKEDFQITMRRFLKGDEGMVPGVMWWLKQQSKEQRSCNYITSHNGFTLADLVSYDGKHNEANGENNQDGPDYNYSWNCGAEGATRRKAVLELRKKQMRNAFFLLLMAQGTPCLLAGDEFANSQKGNNNVYCQDNETAWLNWKQLEKEKELFDYVRNLIALRKRLPILHSEKPLLGRDEMSCGVPDVSYHGESAWQIPQNVASRQLGVYYHGEGESEGDCFIAYNMHWTEHKFALPALSKGKRWYRVFSTEEELKEEMLVENQKETVVNERTIIMFLGR